MEKAKYSKYTPLLLIFVYLILSNRNLFQVLFIDIGHNSLSKLFFFSCVSLIFFFFILYFSP